MVVKLTCGTSVVELMLGNAVVVAFCMGATVVVVALPCP